MTKQQNIVINPSTVKNALTLSEQKTLMTLVDKLGRFSEIHQPAAGDTLIHRKTEKRVTYLGKANMGASYIDVEEFEFPVYLPDYRKLITKKDISYLNDGIR